MSGRSYLIRACQLGLLCAVIGVTLGATDSSARFDKDSHEMMCVCGCNQLLGECNHVGCPDSDGMRTELAAAIARGESDNAIFHQFQQEYGPVVLAAPMFTRFNRVAWIVPPAMLLLGVGLVLLIVRKWRPGPPAPELPDSPAMAAARERIRRETHI